MPESDRSAAAEKSLMPERRSDAQVALELTQALLFPDADTPLEAAVIVGKLLGYDSCRVIVCACTLVLNQVFHFSADSSMMRISIRT